MKKVNIRVLLECYCAGLLSFEKNKPFVYSLLSRNSGQWYKVSEIVMCSNFDDDEKIPHEETLFVTWLNDPGNETNYSFILFYDMEIGWCLNASYNREAVFCEPNELA